MINKNELSTATSGGDHGLAMYPAATFLFLGTKQSLVFVVPAGRRFFLLSLPVGLEHEKFKKDVRHENLDKMD